MRKYKLLNTSVVTRKYIFADIYQNSTYNALSGELKNKIRNTEYGQMVRIFNTSIKTNRNQGFWIWDKERETSILVRLS